MSKCARGNCSRTSHRRGLCHAHYNNYRHTKPIGKVPVQMVRDHLTKLFQAGMTQDRISEISGVSRRSCIARAFEPDRKYVRACTAAKLLAIPVPEYATPSGELCKWIPAIGTVRRLRALVAMGWQQRELQERLGVCQQTISEVVNGTERVRTDFAQKTDVLFRELQLSVPPDSTGAKRAKLRAAKRGWHPPLSWDMETIDRPSSMPDVGGDSPFIEAYEDARDLGRSKKQIAAFYGLQVDSLEQRVRRERNKVA